jgi:hypothetical protein
LAGFNPGSSVPQFKASTLSAGAHRHPPRRGRDPEHPAEEGPGQAAEKTAKLEIPAALDAILGTHRQVS